MAHASSARPRSFAYESRAVIEKVALAPDVATVSPDPLQLLCEADVPSAMIISCDWLAEKNGPDVTPIAEFGRSSRPNTRLVGIDVNVIPSYSQESEMLVGAALRSTLTS